MPWLCCDCAPCCDCAVQVHPIIAGLGLFENRIRSVLAISKKFIEMDEFTVGLEPEVKIYGIGTCVGEGVGSGALTATRVFSPVAFMGGSGAAPP